MIAADGNILVRLARISDPLFAATLSLVRDLRQQDEQLVVFPQQVYEFWTVATRQEAANGLGMSVVECDRELRDLPMLFQLLSDPPDLLERWHQIVLRLGIRSYAAYDARIVAAMQAHGIDRILTYNAKDFTRYPGLTVLDPKAV